MDPHKDKQNSDFPRRIFERYYYLIISVIFLIGIGVMLYSVEQHGHIWKFVGEIGSFVSAVIAVHFLYDRILKKDERYFIVNELNDIIQLKLNSLKYDEKIVLYDSYREVDWTSLIEHSDHEIVIAVHYCNQWLSQHFESFLKFLKKKNSKIRIIVPDINQSKILDDLSRMYPDYTKEIIKRRVSDTIIALDTLIREANIDPNKVELYFCNHVFNYSRHSFDKTLFMSFVEMYRSVRFCSPMIAINTDIYKKAKAYFEKEFDGLLSNSVRLNWEKERVINNVQTTIKSFNLSKKYDVDGFEKYKNEFLQMMSRLYEERYFGNEYILMKLYDENYTIFLCFDNAAQNRIIGCSYVNIKGKFSGLAVVKEFQGLGFARRLINYSLTEIPYQFIEVRVNNLKLQNLLRLCGFRPIKDIDKIKANLREEVKYFSSFEIIDDYIVYDKSFYKNEKILYGKLLMFETK
jgi:ribosomal protein S18 acetylase RimI-like enzyme